MQPEEELVQQWLARASLDVRSADVDLAAQPPLTEDACFHCQQAAEKALKAFLVHHGVEFEKVHDIERILDLVVKVDDTFEELRASAAPLTIYAIRFRYPHTDAAPTLAQAQQKLDVASQVLEFVLARLPDRVHPPGDRH